MPEGRRIKILFIIDTLFGFAGTEKHLYSLIRNLDGSRYECHIVAFKGTEHHIRRMRAEGYSIQVMELGRFYSMKSFRKYVELVHLIRRERFDIVQTFHFSSDTVGVILARLAGARNIVSSRRDMGFKKSAADYYANRVADLFIRKFIVVSNAVGDEIARKEKISRGKITTIYNGIDPEKFRLSRNGDLRGRLGIRATDFIVGMVAQTRPEKNHRLLFEAIRLLKERGRYVRCLLVGGPDVESYRKNCERIGISENVVFAGIVENVADYISLFDIACLTSTTEGFPNALLEKMALGKPVVATRVGGTVELVKDRDNGFLVSPDSPREVADSILCLLDNPELRKTMGEKNREIVGKRFSMENMVRQHEDLYEELVRRPSRGTE